MVSCGAGLLVVAFTAAGGGGGADGVRQATPELSIKSSIGTPGSEVRVPIYLDPSDAKIGALTFRVSFPAPPLSFMKLEIASRRLEPVAKTSKSALVDGTSGVLEVEMSNPEEPLPAGPLGWLVFRIADDARVEELALRLTRSSGRSVSDDTIARIEVGDGKVMVIDKDTGDALLACFFYMH